jgi:hypothetical protein
MSASSNRQQGRRLRLHRETLRHIAAADLERARGGGYVSVATSFAEQPHSNAWSSDLDNICRI